MSTLEIIAAIDAALTIANKLTKLVQEKREVGEMTPEEEKAFDEALEKKFASWTVKQTTGEAISK
jgi:polyhydroxyalkanoate synthesis regulator phasin